MGFSYRQYIGKLIYALTICRIDISITIITLSQHSLNPVEIHYKAVKNLSIYLNSTKRNGLTYWRIELQLDLPVKPDPVTISKESTLKKYEQHHKTLEVVGLCDATWASDRKHQRSMGGIIMMLVGAAVYYRTRLQPTIAQSTTEA